MNKVQRNLIEVLDNIKQSVTLDPDEAKVYAHELDLLLDQLAVNDFFGTEQQSDPRGDFRNENWSIKKKVQIRK